MSSFTCNIDISSSANTDGTSYENMPLKINGNLPRPDKPCDTRSGYPSQCKYCKFGHYRWGLVDYCNKSGTPDKNPITNHYSAWSWFQDKGYCNNNQLAVEGHIPFQLGRFCLTPPADMCKELLLNANATPSGIKKRGKTFDTGQRLQCKVTTSSDTSVKQMKVFRDKCDSDVQTDDDYGDAMVDFCAKADPDGGSAYLGSRKQLCDAWLSKLTTLNQNQRDGQIIKQFCDAHSTHDQCKCQKRDKDPGYQNALEVGLARGKASCWWGPCMNPAQYLVAKTYLSNNNKIKCAPISICANIIHGLDKNVFKGNTQTINCAPPPPPVVPPPRSPTTPPKSDPRPPPMKKKNGTGLAPTSDPSPSSPPANTGTTTTTTTGGAIGIQPWIWAVIAAVVAIIIGVVVWF